MKTEAAQLLRLSSDSYATTFKDFCPQHAFAWENCNACCHPLKADMWRLDNELRVYWFQHGYTFSRRRP